MEFDHIAVQVPDIAAAVGWWQQQVPSTTVTYQDESWALIKAAGAKIAFVTEGQHPDHTAFRCAWDEIEQLAKQYGKELDLHRDGTRGFYLEAPGGHVLELIAYPD